LRKIFKILRDRYIQENPEFIGSPRDCLDMSMRQLEQMVGEYDSSLLSYTLTWHSIVRILRLLYRIYSNVPVILMGETGSGKSYTIKFLAGIAGSNIEQIRRVIDGGTTEADLRDFIRNKLKLHEQERQKTTEGLIGGLVADPKTPAFLQKFFSSLIDGEKPERNLTLPNVQGAVTLFLERLASDQTAMRDLNLEM
jgi:energy-coupling factor transporter ATP-binding protein EcfA2